MTGGRGVLTIDDEDRQIGAGQAVLIPAGSTHTFANSEAATRLEFFNVYWPPAHGAIEL